MTLNFKSFGLLLAATSSNAGGPSSAALNSLVAFSVKTQSSVHFKINSISELINKKSKLKMKLLIFFNGTTVFISSNSFSISSPLAGSVTLKTF